MRYPFTRMPARQQRNAESNAPWATIPGVGERLFSFLFMGGMLLVYALAALTIDSLQERDEQLIYLLTFFAFPIAVVAMHRYGDPDFLSSLFIWNGLGLNGLLAYLVVVPGFSFLMNGKVSLPIISRPALLYFALVHFAVTSFLLVPWRHALIFGAPRLGWVFSRASTVLMNSTSPLLLLFVGVYSSWGAPFSEGGLIHKIATNGRFGLFLLLGLGLAIAVFVSGRAEQRMLAHHPIWHRRAAMAVLGICIPITLLFFDHTLLVNLHHYRALVEPALNVRHGAIPFVEAHSHYGFLPFILVFLAFQFLPTHYETAALVGGVLNIAYLVVFLLLVYRMSDRKMSALILAIMVIIFHVTSHKFKLTLQPSLGGFRYLLPMSMALATSYLPRDRWYNGPALAVLLAASFWSLEAFLWSLAGYVGFLIGFGVIRRQVSIPLRGFALLAGVLGLAHGLFSMLWMLIFDRLPGYAIYLEMVYYVAISLSWATSASPYYWEWAIYAGAYFLALSYFLDHGVGTQRSRGIAPMDWWLVSQLLPTVAIGIMFVSYFVGHTEEYALHLASLPLFAAAISAIDRILSRIPDHFPARRSLCLSLTAVFGVVAAAGLERFTRPYDHTFGNATVFRLCFSDLGCAPARVISGAIDRIFEPDASRLRGEDPVVRDAVELIRHHAPDQKRIAVFINDGYYPRTGNAFVYANAWHKWPISNIQTDQFSPRLMNSLRAHPVRFEANETVIAFSSRDVIVQLYRNFPLARDLIASICADWNFGLVAQTANDVTAIRLIPRLEGEADWTASGYAPPMCQCLRRLSYNLPEFQLRYRPEVGERERIVMENRYGLKLVDCDPYPLGSEPERRTWIYALEDSSPRNIKAMLEDPRLEDVAGIDGKNYRVINPPRPTERPPAGRPSVR